MASIAVLTSRFPFPLEKGDKLRVYNQIKSLSERNEVHLIALTETPVSSQQREALAPYCKSIHVFRLSKSLRAFNLFRTIFQNMPLQVGLFYSRSTGKRIADLLSRLNPDRVYCHLIRMSEYVRHEKKFRKTIDYMDTFSQGMKKRAEISNPLLKRIFLMEYKRLVDYEKGIFSDFDRRVIISSQDRDLIQHPEKLAIQCVANGVDFNEFFPVSGPEKYDLFFTGNMHYPPNIESAIYSATRILPLIHKTHPHVTLLIAGIGAKSSMNGLTGNCIFIREDFSHIREAFSSSKVMLAPMFISIGMQNKILQAMAMKKACVASTLANNAIGAVHNESIMEADSPEEFASACISLLEEKERYDRLVQNAYLFVKEKYSWDLQNRELEKIILS